MPGCALVGYDLDALPDASEAVDGGANAGDAGGGNAVGSGMTGTGRPDGGGPTNPGMPPGGPGSDAGCASGPRCGCVPEATFCDGDVLVVCDEAGRIASAADCAAAAGECEVGRCDAEQGCSIDMAEDDTACDDGLFCTTGEVCQDGACGGGEGRDCSGKDSQCTAGKCDEDADRCAATPTHEGLACDDRDDCTLADKCKLGSCRGAAKDCSSHDGECKAGVCDDETGNCIAQSFPNGTPCADGKICGDGVCQPGQGCGLGQQCTIGCDAATTCLLECRGAKECQAGCSGGATCNIDCVLTDACKPTCTSDSTCTVSCRSTNDCDVVCDASACSVDCTTAANCDQVECLNGASCVISCGANPKCAFKDCWAGDPTSCNDGTIVCGRACG